MSTSCAPGRSMRCLNLLSSSCSLLTTPELLLVRFARHLLTTKVSIYIFSEVLAVLLLGFFKKLLLDPGFVSGITHGVNRLSTFSFLHLLELFQLGLLFLLGPVQGLVDLLLIYIITFLL